MAAHERDIAPDLARDEVAARGAAADGDGLGSRAHVRSTIARAREAIRASHERTAQSRLAVARAEALVGASDRVLQASTALRAQLRASVTAYVHRLKREGLPPERMLVDVKSAVIEATPSDLEPFERRELMDEVVRWSIEAYYEAA